MSWLYVFIGGGIGSLLRYIITKCVNPTLSVFPFGTFIVNVLGSLLIGFFAHFMLTRYQASTIHSLIISGFCGGFTTFSAFSLENLNSLRQGNYMAFSLYVIGTLILGILAVFLGMEICKLIFIGKSETQ